MKLLIATFSLAGLVVGGMILTPPPSALSSSSGGGTNCTPTFIKSSVPDAEAKSPSDAQRRNARTILDVATQRRIDPRGTELAIATALVESDLKNLASLAVPESLTYPHDDVAPGDHDSVGIMQQRPSQGWGTVGQLMNPAYAAGKFFDELQRIDYNRMEFTDAAQAVQRSAYPDRYGQHQPRAVDVLNQITGTNSAPCKPTSASFATSDDVRAVVEFAYAQRDKAYIMGADGPNAWDCSSLAQAAWAKAGITLPRTAQAQRDYLAAGHGQRIQPGKEAPGDLIFWDSYLGPTEIGHVVLVLDPRTKTTIEAHGRADGVGIFTYDGKADRKSIYEIWRPISRG